MENKVKWVIGHGAYAMVYLKTSQNQRRSMDQERQDQEDVIYALKNNFANFDVDVYAREEIPEHLHWCTENSKYCPPILVLARPGTVIIMIKKNNLLDNLNLNLNNYSVERKVGNIILF